MNLTVRTPTSPTSFIPNDLADFFNTLPEGASGDGHFAEISNNPLGPITPGQRQEIQRLCANALLPKREKTLTLVRYTQFNQEEAAERIRKLQSLLSQLEDLRDHD